MTDIIVTTDPIGQAYTVLADKIAELKAAWLAANPTLPWWQFWKSKASFTAVVSFLTNALNELINEVEQFNNLSGPDKKATVLHAFGTLYDFVVKAELPILVWPFASQVKDFVINTLISYLIDWIVAKYNDGSWAKK